MEAFYLNRYVYLSDLDSVCNSQEEIKYALCKINDGYTLSAFSLYIAQKNFKYNHL